MSIWEILGIEETKDKRKIKKAYARMIAKYHPEEFPEKFQEIQKAYETAMKLSKNNKTVYYHETLTNKPNKAKSYGDFEAQTQSSKIIFKSSSSQNDNNNVENAINNLSKYFKESYDLNTFQAFFNNYQFQYLKNNDDFIDNFNLLLKNNHQYITSKHLDLIEHVFKLNDKFLNLKYHELFKTVNILKADNQKQLFNDNQTSLESYIKNKTSKNNIDEQYQLFDNSQPSLKSYIKNQVSKNIIDEQLVHITLNKITSIFKSGVDKQEFTTFINSDEFNKVKDNSDFIDGFTDITNNYRSTLDVNTLDFIIYKLSPKISKHDKLLYEDLLNNLNITLQFKKKSNYLKGNHSKQKKPIFFLVFMALIIPVCIFFITIPSKNNKDEVKVPDYPIYQQTVNYDTFKEGNTNLVISYLRGIYNEEFTIRGDFNFSSSGSGIVYCESVLEPKKTVKVSFKNLPTYQIYVILEEILIQ